jgi:hypothetical protein
MQTCCALAGVQCIPLLTCQLHQGLVAKGDHLISRCQGWSDDMARQRGWAPEAGSRLCGYPADGETDSESLPLRLRPGCVMVARIELPPPPHPKHRWCSHAGLG